MTIEYFLPFMILIQPLYSFQFLKHSWMCIRIEERFSGILLIFTFFVFELESTFSKEIQCLSLSETHLKSQFSCSRGQFDFSIVWQAESCDYFIEIVESQLIVGLIVLNQSIVSPYFKQLSPLSETISTVSTLLSDQTVQFDHFSNTFTNSLNTIS